MERTLFPTSEVSFHYICQCFFVRITDANPSRNSQAKIDDITMFLIDLVSF